MEKGSIYYDTKSNMYNLITSHVSAENTVSCMIFDGYQTQHKYIASCTVAADFYDKHDERYVQVGGIY